MNRKSRSKKVLRNKIKKNKSKKDKQKKLTVNLIAKDSNGISNWDRLTQSLGYEVKKKENITTFKSLKDSDKMEVDLKKSTKTSAIQHIRSTSLNFARHSQAVKSEGSKANTIAHNRNSGGSKAYINTDNGSKVNLTAINDIGNTLSSRNGYERNSLNKHHIKRGNVQKKEKITSQIESSGKKVSTNSSDNRCTRHVAIDCEMVGTGQYGQDSMIARVSIVNKHGDCIYDEYVKPVEPITDFRTPISGIRPSDLTKGKDLYTVQCEVLKILENRILVGHAIKHDLDVLFISHPKHMIRDSVRYKPFRDLFNGQTPSLKKLAAKLLGVEIQSGEHSSVEDAQAAMQIYLMHQHEWEKSIKLGKRKHLAQRQKSPSTDNSISVV